MSLFWISSLFFLSAAPSQEKDAKSLIAMAEALEKDVETLRGLKFKRPVKKSVMSKVQLKEYLKHAIAEEMPTEKTQALSKIYGLLGLLPANYDLEKGILETLESQVAGLYDPKKQEFFLVEGVPTGLQKITIVHEMVHALDDQYFDLQKMMDRVKDHEDGLLGVRAVVEGSGTLIMSRYQVKNMGDLMKDMASIMEEMKTQQDQLKKVPPYLFKTLAGAYLLGQTFLVRGGDMMMAVMETKKGEAADFERAFQHPPLSSEQVIHPEKYWDEKKRDEPVEIRLPDLSSVLGEGWKKIGEDTLGELNVATITTKPEDNPDFSNPTALMSLEWSNDAAEGWDGDRFIAFEKEGKVLVAWLTIWDRDQDATEFETVFVKMAKPNSWIKRDGRRVAVVLASVPGLALEKVGQYVLEKSAFAVESVKPN